MESRDASETAEEERFIIVLLLGTFFGNAFIIVKVVLVDVRQVATGRPEDVCRQALVEILLDVGSHSYI